MRFWGKEQGPTVFLWESLGEEGREECEQAIRMRKDWVVWSRARPAKGDCKIRGFEQEVQKGWWKRGDVEAKLNTVNMTAWVHKECDSIQTGALTKLQEAWDSSEQKDKCIVCLDDLERAYWMGTDIGQLGGYGFQGVALGVDRSCKDGRMGAGCCKFRKEGEDRRARVGREEEGASSNRPELGGVVLALQSAALSEDALLLCDNEAGAACYQEMGGTRRKSNVSHSARC